MSEPNLQHSFWAALGAGDPLRMRELVGAGADVNQPIGNPGGETPLIRAISAGNLELVRLLLELGADVNLAWKGPRAWTPLMFAHDQPALLRELLAAGADPNARSAADWLRTPSGRMVQRPGGQTALHLAAMVGNAVAVSVLVEGGAEVEARAEDGNAPLDYAVRSGAVTAAAEALVQAGAQLTPERLAAMHAAASEPDSDLLNFPVSSTAALGAVPSASDQPPHAQQAVPPPQPAVPPPGSATEVRCPTCHALLYSRKSRLCGKCGAVLPPELLLTDQQAQALEDQRAWARELANKFSNRPVPATSRASDPGARVQERESAAGTTTPQDLLRVVSCVEEFRHRPRPYFWLCVLGYSAVYAAVGLVLLYMDAKLRATGLPPTLWVFPPWHVAATGVLLGTACFGAVCFRAWRLGSPICPNCRGNIRFCAASFCHVCGQPLQGGRCSLCGVDSAWTGYLRPYTNNGNYRWITYCPGCGVRLEARMTRWRPGR